MQNLSINSRWHLNMGKKYEPLKVGIVGCGLIADSHLSALRKISRCKPISICDINLERAKRIAERYKIPRIYGELSDMLEQEQLDIVHILTPPQLHATLSMQAMDKGCNVLVEKPMAVSIEEADKMIASANKNNVKLSVCHNFLFYPCVQKAIALFHEGRLGRLVGLELFFSAKSYISDALKSGHRWLFDLPCGVFGESLPHALYLELAFLRNVKKVNVLKKVTPESPLGDLKVMLDADDVYGSFTISHSVDGPTTLVVYGTEMITVSILETLTLLKIKARIPNTRLERAYTNISPSTQLVKGTLSAGKRVLMGYTPIHEALIRAFYQSIQNGSSLPVDMKEGREVVKLMEIIGDQIQKQESEKTY